MKKEFLLVGLIVAVALVTMGCGKNETTPKESIESNVNITENVNNAESTNITENTNEAPEEELRPDIKMANVWMNLPENINFYWRIDEKNTNNYSVTEEYKRGNNVMRGGESRKNGTRPSSEANWLDNRYYYYEYQGDYKWKSYVHYLDTGWKDYYFNGNYPSSPQTFCMGRPYDILDNYSDTHVTINIEGLGEVDTVVGTLVEFDGDEYTLYYSKDLGMNVKIENTVQAWYMTKYDANVSSEFPHPLPNI